MNDSLKYTIAQKITFKNCFYALIFFKVFVLIVLCLVAVYGSRDENLAFTTTSFFHPFKIILSISIVLFVCGIGFGGIIDIYKKNRTTILIKHFNIKYLIQFLILFFAIATYIYSKSLIPQLEISQQETESGWLWNILNALGILFDVILCLIFIIGVYIFIKDLINNRKDYIKIDEDKIEFFNSICNTDEDSSNEIEEFTSIKNEEVKKVELQFEIYNDVKSLESIKFILKNKKEVVMDLEEMSLSSYDNLIQDVISSRFKGLVTETSNL